VPTRTLFLVVLLVVAGCQGAAPRLCTPYWPDIPLSVAEIPSDPPVIQLAELWRAGGSAEGEEIAEPASIAVSSRGAVAVVDFWLAQVSVISPEGEWLGSWGRRGRGPGELMMPVAANWSGDTLVVFDIEQAKVVRYVDAAHVDELRVPVEFITPVAMSGSIDFVAVAADGTVLLQQPLAALSPDSSALVILAQRPGASRPDTVVGATVAHVEMDWMRLVRPGTAAPLAAVGPDGWLVRTAGDGSYRIAWGDGDAQAQLCAAQPPLPLTPEERGAGEAPAGFEKAAAAVESARPPATLNSVGRVLVGSSGDLWIDRRRPRPFLRERQFGVAGGAMDVFDSGGGYRGRAVIPDRVMIQGVADSVAIGIEFGEFDEVTVVAYRLGG